MELSIEDFFEGDFIPKDVIVICVAGGSGSGKSFVAERIADKVGARVLAMDDYILPNKITRDSNWDLPECWDLDLLNANLKSFLDGRGFKKPVYDFRNGGISKYEVFEAGGRIVVEGLHSLHDLVFSYSDFSVFVESPESVRLARVVKRDFSERGGYNESRIKERWNNTIQSAFLKYVDSQKWKVDFIVLN